MSTQSNNDRESIIRHIIKAKHRADEAARNDEDLRMQACALVDDLKELITDHAEEMAENRGSSSPFDEDECADLLIWALVEFLAQGIFPLYDMEEAPIAKAHQLTQRHAMDWFHIQLGLHDELIPAPVKD